MFVIKKFEGIYVVKHVCNLSLPIYLHQLPSSFSILDHLYSWLNYEVDFKGTILSALISQESNIYYANVDITINSSKPSLSPNIYLTSTKSRKQQASS